MRYLKAAAVSGAVSVFLALVLLGTAHARAEERVPRVFDISPQSLATALSEFARQGDVELLFAPEVVEKKKTVGVRGKLEPLAALAELLKDTGLGFRITPNGAVLVGMAPIGRPSQGRQTTVRADGRGDSDEQTSKGFWSRFRLAQIDDQSPQESNTDSPSGEKDKDDQNASKNSSLYLAEIIVTARRREEALQDVPMSIVTKTGEELADAQVDAVDELSRVVAGLVLFETNPGGTGGPTFALNLRGVGNSSGHIGVDPTVGMVIDGVVMGYTNAFGQDFSDVERIEILRGPQGTLFGKNSSGGVVNIVTKDSTESLSGNLGVSYGSYNEIKAQGSLSGPIAGDDLLGRVSFYGTRRDGKLLDVLTGEKMETNDQRGMRATFLYQPKEETRLRLTIYDLFRHFNFFGGSAVRELGPLTDPFTIAALSDIAGPTNDRVRLGEAGVGYFDTDFWGSSVQWDQHIGEFTLTSITAHLDWKWNQVQHGIAPPGSFITDLQITFPFRDELWTQELRIASPTDRRVDYVAGLYYFDEMHSADEDTLIIIPSIGNIFVSSTMEVNTLNYAAFGEANFHINDAVTLIAGARWTNEEKDLYVEGFPPPPGHIGLNASADPGVTQDSISARNWSWRAGARWEPSDDFMLYATASRGFKGPGIQGGQKTTSQLVRPEVVTNFELGLKALFLNSRMSAGLALFHADFDDFQTVSIAPLRRTDGSVVTLPNGDPFMTSVLTNAAKIRTQGVELELQAVPTDNLKLSLGGSYIDSQYEEFQSGPCYPGQLQLASGCVAGPGGVTTQDLSGTRMPFAPRYSGNVGADYELRFEALPFNAFLHADYSWRDKVQWSQANAPQGIEPAYGLVNAAIGVRDKEGHFTFTLYGKNLTDKFHTAGIENAGYGVVSHSVPLDYRRIYSASFNYQF